MKRFLFLTFLLAPLTGLAQRAEFTLETIDSETKLPLPCRLEVKNQRGVAQRADDLPFWYDHFISSGSVPMRLPVGTYPMKIERGLEYLPVQGHFVLNRSARDTKTETLRRFTHLAKKGWWSGDLLVLRPEREIEATMLGDDVHFVPLLGESNPSEPEHWFDSNRVYTTRNVLLQHHDLTLAIFNLPTEIDWESLKLEEKDSPIPFLYVLKKKYPRIWIDVVDVDCWDLPLLVALGLVDSVQILGPHIGKEQLLPRDFDWATLPRVKKSEKIPLVRKDLPKNAMGCPSEASFLEETPATRYRGAKGRQRWTEDVYFHLLNAGKKIAPSAGSGSGLSPNPVGANRVYVFVDPRDVDATSEEGFRQEGAGAGFTTNAWWEALRGGSAVVTNGPLLEPRVDGCLPGFTFEYEDESPVSLEIGLTLSTRSSIQYLEVIFNGRVEKSIRFQDYAKTGRLPALEVPESGWFLLRVVTDVSQTYCCAMTAPFYVRLGNQSPVQRDSALFFLRWTQKRISMLEKMGALETESGKQLQKLHRFALRHWAARCQP
ncbi:MAG: hypothetical protein Q4D62_11500 [Planctomycetia bacterium]|nr:hypothetical protein [Planctomycetia bacterium]